MDGYGDAVQRGIGSDGGAMREVCGATGELPLGLALGAVQIAGEGRDALELIAPTLRCTLGPHRGCHRDLVLDMDEGDSAVWTSWRSGEPPAAVEVLRNCGAATGGDAGRAEACTHFAGHPGDHSWALLDPVLTYIDQYMSCALLRAAAQYLDAVGRAPRRGSAQG
ncbi:hypothetical protein ACIBEA_11710 [Streptomyces sp. NPDC051555]|uniref:hypothetical protein n=1 Tax=Streptomyces sp. NPDC051555 TaxID=3365657 RepID=UPI00379ECCDD